MAAQPRKSTEKVILRSKMCPMREHKWPCRYCPKTFTESFNASRHEQYVHPEQYQRRADTQPKPFKCMWPGCSYSGPSAGALATHRHSAHRTTVADKTCRYCGNVFSNKTRRITHEENIHESMQLAVSIRN